MSQKSGNLGDLSMYDLFRLEVESQVALLNKNLLDLDSEPESPNMLEALMRASHSLKGAARMVGVTSVVEITHVMEDCFVAAQNSKLILNANDIDFLLKASDLIELIAKVNEDEQKSWFENNQSQVDVLVSQLKAILDAENKSATVKDDSNKVIQEIDVPKPVLNTNVDGKSDEDRTLRIDADRMSRILGMTSELLVESRTISRFTDSLNMIKRNQDELMNILERSRERNERIGGETDEDYQQSSMNRLNECRRLLAEHLSQLDEYDRRNGNLSNKLYNEVAGSRMTPFAEGAVGFKRMVRDLGRDLSKEVVLNVVGMDTLVDRDVLEKIKAPLNHLLRNAVDHGIENVEQRAASSKNQKATITLRANHGGGMLRIIVQDDGAGIDINSLSTKLVDKGLVSEATLTELDESELLEFLFLPDFSTRNEVTEISGRGVGLDVVRNMVRELGGTVSIDTKKDHGTKFTLQLPLTLSVISALLVDIADEPYAFPLVRVDRILRVSSDQIKIIEGRQYVKCGIDNIGLISGSQILGFDAVKDEDDEVTIVVVSDRLDRYGVVVDKFIGQRQLSVQALDMRLGKIPDVSSVALMEDGSPLFILDVDDLVRSIDHLVRGGRLNNAYEIAKEKSKSKRKQVLVVDDSLTIREVERDLLESMGYQVEVAVDGMDGWNAVRTSHYDLVITDIDMPRMDGIELVKAIKQDLHLKSIPVMIVSYKDRSDDRRRGLEAGADYYLAKGNFQDEVLLEAVTDLIGDAVE